MRRPLQFALPLCLCLLAACASVDSPRAASTPSRTLGPLREFSRQEWQRIRAVQPAVRKAARHNGLSSALINGMVWVESKFKRRARGRRGPRGLLQLMPRTGKAMARRLGRRYAPYKADFNIAAGVAYLRLMYERFERLELALAAYNGGPGAVLRWRRSGSPAPGPRHRYVTRVLQAARAFCTRLDPTRNEHDIGPYRCRDSAPDWQRTNLVARARAPAPTHSQR